MHVTYLVDSPTYGGAEITVLQLLRHLPAHVRRTVVATEPVPPSLAAAATRHAELVRVAPVGADWRRLPALRASLAALRPDLVHANLVDPRSNRVAVAAARTCGDVAAVATCHMVGAVGGGAGRAVLRDGYRRLDAVLVPTREVRDLLVGELGVPGQRVHRITNGVDPVRQVPRREPGPPVLGGVGRLTAQKGFDLLVDASRRLSASGHRHRVRVAGDGRDRRDLEAAADGAPVEFVGFVRDVGRFLARLDVFVLPSRAEGLPLALLEAMMAGLPCVAADVGGIAEEAGDAVVVVPPDDVDALAGALRRLLDDAPLRRDLGRRAAAVARRRFDARRTVAAVHGVYTDVLRRRDARRAASRYTPTTSSASTRQS